jgi:DNA-binding beta-propeller fold protein YncE
MPGSVIPFTPVPLTRPLRILGCRRSLGRSHPMSTNRNRSQTGNESTPRVLPRLPLGGGAWDPIERIRLALVMALAWMISLGAVRSETAKPAPPVEGRPLSPVAMAATADGRWLFIACSTDNRILVFDGETRQATREIPTRLPPTGLVLSRDQGTLIATCAGPVSEILILDVASATVRSRFSAGHTAMGPAISPDGNTLFVCHRFDQEIGLYDVSTGKAAGRIPVRREPVAAAITPDGRYLLVANHLHDGRADVDIVAAVVSVVDVVAGKVLRDLQLPNGSGSLQDLRISPDGRYAVVTHVVARYQLPTTQLDRGWMNTNAETIIDLADLTLLNTVLLDSVDSGAANPWGVAWSADGRVQVVAHAGTHEVSLIDFPGLLARLAQVPAKAGPDRGVERVAASRDRTEVPNDLSFLVGLRRRIQLPPSDRGPRAIVVVGSKIIVGNYFSDSLSIIDPTVAQPSVVSIPLGPRVEPTEARKGEEHFNDATLCFQGWQSCATCHPGEARVDALNWDLLNDDMGNPKNNKSLLLSHRTPPAMSLGVRETAETAVRAGIRHILFTAQPDEIAQAMDFYLKSLEPVPSPHLRDGQLSSSARRGQLIFADEQVGCARCHPAGLFTDLQHHDVGTRSRLDRSQDLFDTPTLVEAWRTAPYFHDGSATNLHEMFRSRNLEDRHGRTSHLDPAKLDDLIAYVLSL